MHDCEMRPAIKGTDAQAQITRLGAHTQHSSLPHSPMYGAGSHLLSDVLLRSTSKWHRNQVKRRFPASPSALRIPLPSFGAVLRCEISKILLSRTSWLFALSPGNHHNANESRSLSPLISPLPALAAAVRPPVLGSRQLSVTLCLERTPFSHSSRSFSGTAFDPNVIGRGRSCSPTMFWLLYWISVSCRLKYIR